MPIQPIIDDRDGKPRYFTPLPIWPSGYNRNPHTCMLEAADDWEAMLAFLREYTDKPRTYRSYCREVERFTLWLIHSAGKPLSDLRRDDWQRYLSFLSTPSPIEDWCGPKVNRLLKNGYRQYSDPNPCWRPFESRKEKPPLNEPTKEMPFQYGLADSTAKKAQKIIESMFAYLVNSDYLIGNPLAVRRRRRSKAANTRKQVNERFLNAELIDYTVDMLYAHQQIQATTRNRVFAYVRARYLIQLLAGTGLRLSEAAEHTMGNLTCRKELWTLNVVGKGDKPRTIDYLPDLVHSTREFRIAIGLSSSTPLHNEDTPLIPRENCRESISDRRIDQILKWAFNLAAQSKLEESRQYEGSLRESHQEKHGWLVRDASILNNASAHWLRHSHATYFLKKTNDLKATMERLGHESVDTTMVYMHVLRSNTEFE